MSRAGYPHFADVPTRWADNDVYGHVNNVQYYAVFDTVINAYLIHAGGLDIHRGDTIGLCVESRCAYLRAVAFPDALEAGLRVVHLGRSSVRYEIALFAEAGTLAATGWFVHVFVEREARRPVDVPDRLRSALERLVVRDETAAG